MIDFMKFAISSTFYTNNTVPETTRINDFGSP